MFIGIDASRAGKKIKTGTEWYSYNLIVNLAKIDTTNHYILYTTDHAQFLPQNLPANFRIKILNWPFKYLWTHFRLSWEMLINSPDILFVPAHTIPLINRGCTVVTVHDLGFLHLTEIYRFITRWYLRLSTWWSVHQAQKIIAISNFTKQDILKNYNIPEDKIEVIPLGVDFNFYQTQQVDKSSLNQTITSRPYFLYIGRIEKKKNLETLAKAWQKFTHLTADYNLLLVGADGYGSQKIKNIFTDLKNVKFIGYVNEEEKKYLLKHALAFVFPSYFEGFGLPLLEAMAANCLTISADSTSLPEIGGEAVWYFQTNNDQELSVLLNQVINDQTKVKQTKLLAQSQVKNFDWLITADKTLKLFNSQYLKK